QPDGEHARQPRPHGGEEPRRGVGGPAGQPGRCGPHAGKEHDMPIPGPVNYTVKQVSFRVVRENAVATVKPVLSSPAEVREVARELIPDDAREHFFALYLNSQNRLVAAHEVSVGTLSASLVHAREVFGPALRLLGVASVILVHNHPSGDATPS